MKNSRIAIAIASTLAVASFNASAATDSMAVSATVEASCTVTAPTVALGAYDPIAGTALGVGAQIDFTCANGSTYTVALDNGLHNSTGRRMQHSGAGVTADDYLTYEIFAGTDNTTPWVEQTAAATGLAQSVDIYVEADAGQNTVKSGSYTDTVVITVTAS